MVLGSEAGVTDITDVTDVLLIGRQLILARGIVEDKLAAKGLSLPSTSSTLDVAVNYLTAAMVGVKPGEVEPRTDYEVDGFKRSGRGNKSQLEEWESWGMDRIADYIAANKTSVGLPRSTTS